MQKIAGIKQEVLIIYYVSSEEEDSIPYWIYQKIIIEEKKY